MRIRSAKDFRRLVVAGRAIHARQMAAMQGGHDRDEAVPASYLNTLREIRNVVGVDTWARHDISHYAGDLIARRPPPYGLDPMHFDIGILGMGKSRFAQGFLYNPEPGRLP